MGNKLLLLLIILSLLTLSAGEIYLPIVMKSESYFRITGADCNYVYVEAVNYPVQLSTDYYAGSVSITKYGTGIPVFTNLHYWPEESNETIKHYYAPSEGYFELGVIYGLDAWVKIESGGGIVWVENGDQLWMPCKPHSGHMSE